MRNSKRLTITKKDVEFINNFHNKLANADKKLTK